MVRTVNMMFMAMTVVLMMVLHPVSFAADIVERTIHVNSCHWMGITLCYGVSPGGNNNLEAHSDATLECLHLSFGVCGVEAMTMEGGHHRSCHPCQSMASIRR